MILGSEVGFMNDMPGVTIKSKVGCGTLYITCCFDDAKLVRVFLKLGKAGTCQRAFLEGLSKVMSKAGDNGLDLMKLANGLVGIQCPEALPGVIDDPKRVVSCMDAVGKAMLRAQEQWKGECDDPTKEK